MRVLAVVLLGFALRLLRLPALGDLEFDEIVSVRYASLSADALLPRLSGALFEHPPAYYLLLGWWRAVVGDSDVLARVLSVFPSTLTVALGYAAGTRVFGRRAGFLTALWLAVAPLPLFYGREVRMYALVTCLILASFWLFARAASSPAPAGRRGDWAAFALVSAAATYVHYAGALALAGHVAAAVALRRRHPAVLGPVLLTASLVALSAAPWLLLSSGTRGSLPALDAAHLAGLPAAAWQAWQELAAGPAAAGPAAALSGASLALLVAFGLPAPGWRRASVVALLLAGGATLAIAVLLGKPVQARYLLPVAPFVYLCAAGALGRALPGKTPAGVPAAVAPASAVARRRPSTLRLPQAGAVVLALGALPFYVSYYGGYRRADYSDITRQIQLLERPGDAVLLTGPWQAWYFDYYYRGSLPHFVLPKDAPPALDPAVARGELEQLTQGRRRLWFIQAGLAQADPTGFVSRWLRRNAWPATYEAHQNAVLSLYALDSPESRRPLQPVVFGDALRLSGGWVDGEEVPAGDVVRLELELEALRRPVGNYKASLRLVGADGQRVATDFDLTAATGDGDVPTSAWQPGARVVIRRGVWLPVSTNPQPYDVRLVVYDAASLAPLPAVPVAPVAPVAPAASVGHAGAGGEVSVGGVYVTQSLAALPPESGAPYQPLRMQFGGGDEFDTLHLAGVRWHQVDSSAGPVTFDLLWRLEGVSGTLHHSRLRLLDGAGRVVLAEHRPLFGGAFAMWEWREGETIGERRALDLSTLPRGTYRLLLDLEDARGRRLPAAGAAASVELARLDVPYRRPLSQRLAGAVSRLARLLPRVLPLGR